MKAENDSFPETPPKPPETLASACVACGEPIEERLPTRPEYCFVCAVHVVCACADEPE